MSDNFKTNTLDSLCELIVDCPHSTPTWTTFGYVVIRNQNITDGVLDLSSPSYTDYSGYRDRTKRASPQENDIVITREAPMGRVCLIPKEPICCLGQRQVLLRADRNKISAEYLYWSLRSPFVQRQILINEGTGATVSNMRIPELKALEIQRLASIEIENKKARDLSNIQNKIQLNTQINQTLEQIAQALFKSWFVDFDPVRAKVQALSDGMSLEQAELAAMQAISGKTPEELTALSQTQPDRYAELTETAKAFPCEMVEIDGVEVPKGWKLSTIGDCYDVVMGQSPKGETYNENKQGMLFYQGRAEFGWRFPTPRLFTTDPKRIAEQNSILMSVRAPVGDINIALEKCCIGRGLAALQHKSKSLSFGLYQIQSIKPELDLFNGEGTVFGSINQANLKNIQIINPDEKFIQLFEKYLSPFDSRIMNNEIENNVLKEIRDLLLPRLLNGES